MTAYAEYEDLLVYGSFDEDNPEEELLSALLETASRIIDNWCGRTFAPGEAVLPHYFDCDDFEGTTLYLDGDLCGVITVTNDGGLLVEGTDYILLPRNSTPYNQIKLLIGYWVTDPEITVTGDWCFSQVPPADIVHRCLRIASWLYHQRDTGVVNQPILVSNGVIVMPANLPDDIQLLLAPYRRYSV